jgi:hypothetical protein
LTTASDGKRYKTKFYSLDVIISVGYRVKSLRGTQFRIWANIVLKEYLMKGHVVNHRLMMVEQEVTQIKGRMDTVEFKIQTNLPPTEGIFFDGQIFDAYTFVSDLVKSASNSIMLIDNYIDDSVLLMLSKRKANVTATIYTQKINNQLKLDLEKHNQQYPPIEIFAFKKSHDRFLIIDNQKVYHIGASLKDLGKKWFAFSLININPEDILIRIKT